MRSRKILTWGGSLALGSLLFWAMASQAQDQQLTLALPPVVNFWFVMVRIPATGAGPVGDGTLFAGLTFPNGASSGAYFQDQTVHNRELVFFGPDGVTPTSAVWQFFGSQQQYNYNYQTEVCTESDFNLTEYHLTIPNATLLATINTDNRWQLYGATTSPGHFVEAGVELNSLSKPGFFLWRDGTNTADMRIFKMQFAPIPSTQWTLPASCAP